VRVVSILAALAVAGCSALTSLDDLSSAQSDAGGGDAGGGSLVTNGGFENGQGGCGTNWGNGYGMTFSRTSPGHTGSSACLVCIQGSNQSYQIDAIATIPVQAGNYYAEAWLDTPWDGGTATQGVGIQVHFTGNGSMSGCDGDGTSYCQGSFVGPGGWASSSTTFVVTGSGTLQVAIHSYDGTPSSCFALDDVAVYAQ